MSCSLRRHVLSALYSTHAGAAWKPTTWIRDTVQNVL